MFVILPIRTESAVRRTPYTNYVLIGLNVVLFLVFHGPIAGEGMEAIKERHLAFQSDEPAIYQFFTYQFLHGGFGHLMGNLVFLWVFGNSVNGKLGNAAYLCFYLAGGVFAAWAYAMVHPSYFHLIGASGAIAAVTTAYMALFPRSHVTVLAWFFIFLHFFELPALLLIGLKIVIWDNVIAPRFGGPSQVAYGAHLAGYTFGFFAALAMLLVRAVPRDQFDILAVWSRWFRRKEFALAMRDPRSAARAQFGSVARTGGDAANGLDPDDPKAAQLAELRIRVGQALESNALDDAMSGFRELLAGDPRQCLPERHQLEIARALYGSGRLAEAAAAFSRYVDYYPDAAEAPNVRFLLGIIYARDLRQYEAADRYLTQGMSQLRDAARRAQCREWLELVRAALGRPAPES